MQAQLSYTCLRKVIRHNVDRCAGSGVLTA